MADIVRVISLGHTGPVRCVAADSSGARALTGSEDTTVRVWDLATGACKRILEGHTARVRSVTFSADGTRAISGSEDTTLRLWNLTTGVCERVLKGHRSEVTHLCYSREGTRALSGSADGTVRVWNLATGGCERVLEGHTKAVRSIALSRESTRALSGSADGTLRVWDLITGDCERVLGGHTGGVNIVALSADGTSAFSGSASGILRVWDLVAGAGERSLTPLSGEARTDAIFCDGTRVVAWHSNGILGVCDLITGESHQVLVGHTRGVRSVSVSYDGTRALSGSADGTARVWNMASGACERVLEGHGGSVRSVAQDAHRPRGLTGSADGTVRVWNLGTGACERVLEGHRDGVRCVGFVSDGRALSASDDRSVRVWDLAIGACERVLEGHTDEVNVANAFLDGASALSGSDDCTIRIWDLATGACERVLEGHMGRVWDVAVSLDGTRAVSGSADGTVRVWDLRTGACQWVLEGHTDEVNCVAVSLDGAWALSGSDDRTVRVWDLANGTCQRVLEGHTDRLWTVAWLGDGITIASAAENGILRLWPPTTEIIAEARLSYTNAKVVMVGESQVGKTGLAMRLAEDRWQLTESTVGAWATHMEVPLPSGEERLREIWLWDFGGQADQRLIQQLYLGDAALAVFVFDGQREDAMGRLWDWSRALRSAAPDVPRILVAGRIDASPVRLNQVQLEEFRSAAGFVGYFETSAKSGAGCDELRTAILESIDWARLPWRTSPVVFKRLKDEILSLKDLGRPLTTMAELRELLPSRVGDFDQTELEAAVNLLAGPGAVQPLGFGDQVLLQPELVNAYAQAVIQSLRDDPLERGCITEERVLLGTLTYPEGFVRLPAADERLVLHAMHRQLVERAICLRDRDSLEQRPTVLVFPSYFRRARPERPQVPQSFMTFRFNGFLDEIYATLVVRLHHTEPFGSTELWRNAADFRSATGRELGLRLVPQHDGTGEIELHCEAGTPSSEQVLFARYVQEHLTARDPAVITLRTYICPNCSTPVESRDAARRRVLRGQTDIPCADCEFRILLWDDIAERLESDAVRRQVAEMRRQAQVKLDSESKERLLVGEVITVVANANQLARELGVSDHGIDMEIEFKDDEGRATGRKLYLQLKSGDSHLRNTRRGRVFEIHKTRHATYWANQQFPVMLVVRGAGGPIEWMEIRDILRRQPVRQILFEGERFDVSSLLRTRASVLRSH